MESFSRCLVLAFSFTFLISTTCALVVCPSGYTAYETGVSCYKYVENLVQYTAAEAACAADGAHLATITSQAEHDFILNEPTLWGRLSYAYVYLGATDDISEGTWIWNTGETWSYESWGIWNRQQLPVHGNIHNCLTMTSVTDVDGDWYDYKCDNTAHYMCEQVGTVVSGTCDRSDGRNWELVGGDCYFLVRGMKNWNQAENNCVRMGANLASVHDQTVNDFFLNTWVNRYGRGMWIGYNDRSVDGTFEWSDGTTGSYTNWATLNGVQQPESTSVKNCVGLESPARGLAGQWNDYKCSMRSWSICKKPVQ